MNSKVVRRTNAIMGCPCGHDFRHEETGLTRSGIGGWAATMRSTLVGWLFLTATAIPATRGFLQRNALPKSGEGQGKEVRETGSYEIVLVGEMPDGTFLKARITGQGDPGVRSATLMLTEAALCLAEDQDRMSVGGGFWTPEAAMGGVLRDRIINHAGMRFELTDAPWHRPDSTIPLPLPAGGRRQRVQNDDPGENQANAEIGVGVEHLAEHHRPHQHNTRNAATGPDGIGDAQRHGPDDQRHDIEPHAKARQGQTGIANPCEALRKLQRGAGEDFNADPDGE